MLFSSKSIKFLSTIKDISISQKKSLNDLEGMQSVKEKIDPILAELAEEGVLTELSKEFFGGEDVSKELDNVDELPVIEIEQN